ncbi:sulfur carrier protein ThiS [Paenibacillus dauci]|uniref:sulfur carrier protein ThiS n=1 Tax=Paenibacillus dauci TaxID=1567106 RepID=UPI000619F829|nr:sulfur carrier protein ThiS [Paenibacillus dauci]
MELMINGTNRVVAPDIQTIEQLLESLQLTGKRVIVEWNEQILQKEEHGTTVIGDGDTLEIVHFVGGG